MEKAFSAAMIVVVGVAVCLCLAGDCRAQMLASPQTFPTSSVSTGPIGQSSVIPITSGMISDYMPRIPNLEIGFQYFFGNKVRSGQASFDYLLPFNLGNSSVVFGEAHGNWWNFAQRPVGGASNRVDLSIGGGYRKILSEQLLVGINGFYDSSRLFNNWYSSGSVGLEFAANIGSSDAVDLNANWYGDIFSSNSILDAFRNDGGSYDIEAGYSHAMFNQALDLRLKFAGYQFDTGSSVYGYKTGADLTTKDGMFTLRYEYGNDRVNGSWNNIGAFVNVGFQMENVIKGENPFTMPEPIFKSPRNLRRMMTQKVKRDWNQQYAPGRVPFTASTASLSLCRTTPAMLLVSPDNEDTQYFLEGAFLEANASNDGCFSVAFNWTSTTSINNVIIAHIVADITGWYLVDGDTLSGTSGTVKLWMFNRRFKGRCTQVTGLRLILDGSFESVTISDPTVCFNQECP